MGVNISGKPALSRDNQPDNCTLVPLHGYILPWKTVQSFDDFIYELNYWKRERAVSILYT